MAVCAVRENMMERNCILYFSWFSGKLTENWNIRKVNNLLSIPLLLLNGVLERESDFLFSSLIGAVCRCMYMWIRSLFREINREKRGI